MVMKLAAPLRVFLSYADGEAPLVHEFYRALTADLPSDIEVFLDFKDRPGEADQRPESYLWEAALNSSIFLPCVNGRLLLVGTS